MTLSNQTHDQHIHESSRPHGSGYLTWEFREPDAVPNVVYELEISYVVSDSFEWTVTDISCGYFDCPNWQVVWKLDCCADAERNLRKELARRIEQTQVAELEAACVEHLEREMEC